MKTLQEHANAIAEAHWEKCEKKKRLVTDLTVYAKESLDVLKQQLDFKPHPLDKLFNERYRNDKD